MLTLLVDDDPFFITITRRFLHLGGYAVETVPDVTQAHQLLKEGGISTVIISETIRDSNRFWEQAQRYYPEIAVLLATSNPAQDSRLYLPMPLSLERVLKAMQEADLHRHEQVESPVVYPTR